MFILFIPWSAWWTLFGGCGLAFEWGFEAVFEVIVGDVGVFVVSDERALELVAEPVGEYEPSLKV